MEAINNFLTYKEKSLICLLISQFMANIMNEGNNQLMEATAFPK